MDKLLVKFWARESWHKSPVVCVVTLGLILGIGGFALKVVSGAVALKSIPMLQVEDKILGTIEVVVGSKKALPKAEVAAKDDWPFPQCDDETFKERFSRLSQAVWCFKARLDEIPTDDELAKSIGMLDLETQHGVHQKSFLEERRQERLKLVAQRDKILGEAGTTYPKYMEDFKAQVAAGENWVASLSNVSSTCSPLDQWVEYGVDTATCSKALNEDVGFPVTTKSMIGDLQGMELTPLSFKDSAQAYIGAKDEGGWEYFPGGALLQPHGPYRDSIQRYISLSSSSEDVLRLPELRRITSQILAANKVRNDTAEDFGEAVQSAQYTKFGDTVKFAGYMLLFFVALSVFWRASTLGVGWRRVIGLFGLVFVGIALMAPTALDALDLSSAKDAIGEPDGLGSVLGAPFAVLAQMMDLLQGWLSSLWSGQTVKTLILVGLFGLIFFATRPSIVAIAAYGILLTERWFASGEFGVLPFDLRAFDATVLPSSLGWAAELLGFTVAVLMVRGLWGVIGGAMIRKGTELLVPAGNSREPQTDSGGTSLPR